MSNTTKKRSTVIMIAIFMTATLVVGIGTTLAAVTTTQSAYAAGGKKDNGKGNDNGNTITIQKCKQEASESGWDNDQEQECENLICTHPGENATCVQEGVVITPQPRSTSIPTPEPTTSWRVVKKLVCLPTDPNCLQGVQCEIIVSTGNPPRQDRFTCQSAIGNGVVFTLQPGDTFNLNGENLEPRFGIAIEGDCIGTIAAGQHLTCTITNTEQVA